LKIWQNAITQLSGVDVSRMLATEVPGWTYRSKSLGTVLCSSRRYLDSVRRYPSRCKYATVSVPRTPAINPASADSANPIGTVFDQK
jgi:hypothetical protein